MDIRSGSLSCLLPGDTKSQYIDHQKAAVYVVSDYLSEKYEPEPESDEKPESEEETETRKSPITALTQIIKIIQSIIGSQYFLYYFYYFEKNILIRLFEL